MAGNVTVYHREHTSAFFKQIHLNSSVMGRVLIVDDSKVVRKFIHHLLTELGFSEVEEAIHGQDALDKCKTSLPYFIILDWNMPVMNGLEFILAFKTLPGAENTKVIFCTTENEFSKIEEAIGAGAEEYIMKPFDMEILKGKLSQLGLVSGNA